MTTWIVVGSSPSVVQHFDAVMDYYRVTFTIACNSAIKLFANRRRPDYFIAVDESAGILLHDQITAAVADGCEFMSYSKSMLVQNKDGKISIPGFFEVKCPRPTVLLDVGDVVQTTYQPYKIVFAQYSGLAAMQYAIQQRAQRVVILGCDGYPGSKPMEDFPVVTFDGHGGDSFGMKQTQEIIEPFMRSMIEQCSNVKFIQYGEPLYEIDAPNYMLNPVFEAEVIA